MIEGKEFRVALLGTGAIAQVVHLPAAQPAQGRPAPDICDVDHPKAEALASRFGIPKVERKDEQVFADTNIDCVIIATPRHLHESQIIRRAAAGQARPRREAARTHSRGRRARPRGRRKDGSRPHGGAQQPLPSQSLALKPFATGHELGESSSSRPAGSTAKSVSSARRGATGAAAPAAARSWTSASRSWTWPLDARLPALQPRRRPASPGRGNRGGGSAAVIFTNDEGLTLSLEVTWSNFGQRDRHYLQMLGTHGAASLSPLAVFKEIEHGLLDLSPQLPAGQGNPYTASYRQQLRHFLEVAAGEREGIAVRSSAAHAAYCSCLSVGRRGARSPDLAPNSWTA